jgi:GH24 family phage-related lysozyme (muramidase)
MASSARRPWPQSRPSSVPGAWRSTGSSVQVFGTGRRLSDSGVDFIGRFEGFRGTLYNDPAEFGGGITPSASRRAAPGRRSHGRVRDHVHVELTQQQLDSMVRFTFNVGAGAFRRPSLLQQLNSSGRYHWTAPITDRLVPSAGTPGIGCLGDGRLGRWD